MACCSQNKKSCFKKVGVIVLNPASGTNLCIQGTLIKKTLADF